MHRVSDRLPSSLVRRSPRGARGAALIEYVLLLAVFIVGVVYSLDLINEEIEDDSSSTAYQIGGVEGTGSTTTTTIAGTTTSTMPVNAAPTVYAGPDRIISPSNTTWTTQDGTVADSNTPASMLDVSWSSSSSRLSRQNAVHSGGSTSVQFRATRPGTYTLTLSASDGFLTGTDSAQIKITSGTANVSGFSVYGWWDDHRLLTWTAETYIRVTNQFNEPISGLTVSGQWSFSNGGTANASCTTNGNGECWIRRSGLSNAISQACFNVTNVTGPAGCFDGWNGTGRSGCVNRDSLSIPAPPTTTTTTRPSSTTTTRPSSTTTTTRPATTTTRPTTTTTTTVAL